MTKRSVNSLSLHRVLTRPQLVQRILALKQAIERNAVSSLEHAREIGSLLEGVGADLERRQIEIATGVEGRTAYDYRRIAREWDQVAGARSIRHANRILRKRRQKARRVVPVLLDASWDVDELKEAEVAKVLAQVRGRSVRVVVTLQRHVVVDAEQPGLFDQV
ncbi:MAG TPA: hypothetical protein VGD94_18895 [Vicinamibacterales bacterium]